MRQEAAKLRHQASDQREVGRPAHIRALHYQNVPSLQNNHDNNNNNNDDDDDDTNDDDDKYNNDNTDDR